MELPAPLVGESASRPMAPAEGIEAVWRREGLPAVPTLASSLGGDEELGYHLRLDEDFGDCPICG